MTVSLDSAGRQRDCPPTIKALSPIAGQFDSSTVKCLALGILLPALLSGCAISTWSVSPPHMPVPLSPEAHTIVSPVESVEFVWSRTDETERYEFHVFNAENSDIEKYMMLNLKVGDICDDTTCRISLRILLPDSPRHAWRVRAVNNAGKSAWSRTLFTFSRSGEPL